MKASDQEREQVNEELKFAMHMVVELGDLTKILHGGSEKSVGYGKGDSGDEECVHHMPIDESYHVARSAPLASELDESTSQPPHPQRFVDESFGSREKTDTDGIMARRSLRFHSELEAERVEYVLQSGRDLGGFFCIPSQDVGIIDVGK